MVIAKLCPGSDVGVVEVEREVDAAFAQFEANDPGGLDAETTPERDALFKHLISFDVDNLILEGLALSVGAVMGEENIENFLSRALLG